MSKFILPAGYVKVKKADSFHTDLMWPVGTQFKHEATGLHFRFLPRGGRWDMEYAITTEKGSFVGIGRGSTLKFGLSPHPLYPDRILIQNADKNKLIACFTGALKLMNVHNKHHVDSRFQIDLSELHTLQQ